MTGPCVVEDCIEVEKEIGVIATRNANNDIVVFPAVEMIFHPTANLVEYLAAPADIAPETEQLASKIARRLIQEFDICGNLAVEFFLTKDHDLLVNEVAPRPHNSGHHTIEGNVTSQFQQHLRGILNLPLGDSSLRAPVALMMNLLGDPARSGKVQIEGFKETIGQPGVFVHLYGKKESKPFRKMGHVTIIDENRDSAIEKAKFVKEHLKIKGV